MKKILVLCMTTVLFVGCKSGDSANDPSGKNAGAETAAKLDKIAEQIKTAKTSKDFEEVSSACSGIEIGAAMDGNTIDKDPKFVEVCKAAQNKARAQVAIAESTPDKMSVHCMSASMGLDDLIENGVQVPEMKKLSADLNKACGM